ncbi:MAG: RnfABCDGE type electron transport complex subunit G [Bacteroidales bacterium]|nr:RnfABCDGE type electron transport complex subunit G [Bacteroidales bacterium]MBQ5605057.1 RnfABCDGE type electron transport complex subunit G [Bacteroidales bacterium]MBR0333455.1 RnfABCDGE type electron transport complex subunit G [Bacteroidales bacterium]
MKKLPSTLTNMVMVLGIIAIVAATLLAWVNQLTAEPIKAAELAKQQAAIKEVTPAFDAVGQVIAFTDEAGQSISCYPALSNGQCVGIAVESYTNAGFNGYIQVMVGFDMNGNIVNYSVLKQAETPGLGTKMVDWFKTEKANQSILGKNLQNGELKVSKDGGQVDAITAATISSRAFLDAVNRAYTYYQQAQASLQAPAAQN